MGEIPFSEAISEESQMVTTYTASAVKGKVPTQQEPKNIHDVVLLVRPSPTVATPIPHTESKCASYSKPCPASRKTKAEQSVNHDTSGSTGNPIAPSYGLAIDSTAIVCMERVSVAEILAASSGEGADRINTSDNGTYIGFLIFATICTC